MHAADAIHGDLGLMNPDDIVLCISKSGNTPEIKVLIPLIKNFGNKVIGMVSHEESFLAAHSDYLIYLPMAREADPNNLAPTTSTTLQMAMGDAIAIALLSIKGFSQENFARFHPGGSLGKKMYLRVEDVIAQNSKPKVYLDNDINRIIIEISSNRLGATAVVDDNENLAGIITDGDLRRMLENKNKITAIRASEIMSGHPKTIQGEALAIEALDMMKLNSITQLIVLDKNKYKGIIHLHDLIREGIL
jgi:arabinose-5-phosphate isomerase